jgi:hypothetical protein
VSYEPEAILSPPGQRLPWVEHGWRDGPAFLPALGLLCFVVVVIPGFLVHRFAARHAWAAGLSASLYGMLAILAVRDGELAAPLGVLVALAVPGQLLFGALRGKSLRLWLLAMFSIGVTLGAFLYKFQTWSYPLLAYKSTLSCLGEVFLAAPCIGLTGLPMVMVIILVIVWIRRRAWRKLGLLLGSSVVLAAIVGLLILVLAGWAGWKDPSERYSWEGWYLVWPLGVYAAGTLILLSVVLKTAFRLLRAAVARVIPQTKPS